MEIIQSKNSVPIRPTAERWFHIIENHDDLAGYYDDVINAIEEPDYIIKGYREALIALKEIEQGKFLAVVYNLTLRVLWATIFLFSTKSQSMEH